jgi:outer membrane protein OmpA-like peptidoglycan-associated protein
MAARPLTPATPAPAAAQAPPAAPQAMPPPAAQRGPLGPPLVSPAGAGTGVEDAYRQALAQSEAASQPPVLVPPQVAAGPTLGLTLPRSRLVYDPRALATIPFAGGSVKLSSADLQTLREVAETQRTRGGMVRVIGHASQEGRGNAANQQVTNFRMSGDRADAVAEALVKLGVRPAFIEIEALGDGEPVTNALGQPEPAASRRVEIHLDN